MTKITKLALALALLPAVIQFVQASTTFVGQVDQNVTVTNTPSVVIAGGTVTAAVSGSTITVTGLGGGAVAVSAASLPLPTGAATEATLTSLNGKVTAVNTGNVTIGAALPAGSNTIGKVDQGVGGASAWKVDGSAVTQPVSAASLPLPTGAATSALQTTGNSSLSAIDGKLNTLGQKAMSASVPVVISSDQSPITVLVSPTPSTTVTKSSVTVDGTSTTLLAASAARLGLECTSLCTNTDYVFININSASAATITDYPLSPCSSWVPPVGMVPTGAIQVIAASGTQGVRCVSYTP